MQSVLNNLSALFCCLVSEGSFPGGSIDQLLEELEAFLKMTRISQEYELHQCMISAPQAASNLDISG